MKTLAACPVDVACTGNTWRGTLREKKGGLTLDVTGSAPFALHLLDDVTLIPTGERSDGVLVTEEPPDGLACFIELKGAIDPDDPDHAFRQVQGSVEHFAPLPNGNPHGEAHHEAWRSGSDLPAAPPRGRGRPRNLAVGAEHVVGGLVVVARGGTRLQSRWMTIAGRPVFVAVVQRHGANGVLPMTVEEIEELFR